MRRRRPLVCAALCAAVLAILAVTGPDGGPSALAQSPTAPVVTFAAPPSSESCPDCLLGGVTLRATAVASTGRTISNVVFAFRPQGDANGAWTQIGQPVRSDQANQPFDTTFPDRLNGLIELRAVATDSVGDQTTVVVRDVAVANDATSVVLDDPGTALRAHMTLRSTTPVSRSFPTEVSFQISPSGAEDWKQIALDTTMDDFDASFSVDFDATDLTGGRYDLRAVAKSTDEPDARFVSRPRRNLLLDREAPVSELQIPAGPLQGVVRLAATAQDGGGVASVRFEHSPAGADSWTAITSLGREPYATDFDTRILEDGTYDFRVVATDTAGNSAASPIAKNVAVSNPGRVAPGGRAVTNVVAPATNLQLLGTTNTGETWATGISTGPPAVVDGHQLDYTRRGNQLVLLRYTEAGGWRIQDVLRDADQPGHPDRDGAAYDVRSTDVRGQMTPSGEAWIVVFGDSASVFHRVPSRFDGQFRRDGAASTELAPLLSTPVNGLAPKQLQVGETTDGRDFGLLVVPNQEPPFKGEPGPDGGTIQVKSVLQYGALSDGTWRLKTLPRPRGYAARNADTLRLDFADLTGPGTGWVAVDVVNTANQAPIPPRIGRLSDSPWDPIVTGLDALDATGEFAVNPPAVTTTGLRAEAGGVWIGAATAGNPTRKIVAHYEDAARGVTRTWCDPLGRATNCGAPLGDAAVPDQMFQTARGPVGVSLQTNFIHTFEYGDWAKVAAPGFSPGAGRLLLGAPEDGWLAGSVAFGRVATARLPEPMATWPQANRSTLLSVALPPGSTGAVGESGALAVGLDGTALGYDASAGWQIQNTPARSHRLPVRAVAFNSPTTAFAVGGAGLILRWDGTSWTEDPQSTQITGSELQGLAFAPDGQGWAVGRFSTILHYDGKSWSPEEAPPEDDGLTISSVTVAGDDVFAISDGNLIKRGAGGRWQHVERTDLPDPSAARLPFDRDLRVVSGLPDGGVVAAGRSVVLVRQRSGGTFAYADQPISGIAVAASAFRDRDGVVRAFVSSAAPIPTGGGVVLGGDIGGFPAGDGVLLRQTADGWLDLSHSQPPTQTQNLTQLVGDGLIKPDPVLAVAASPDGEHAWAVGGYAGTRSAAGQGLDDILQARPAGWRTAHIWRYDSGRPTASPADVEVTVNPQVAAPNTVNFAYFSNVQCKFQCAGTQDAQPDVNLHAALEQIDEYAQQPGGPAFAVLGGNARGPVDLTAFQSGNAEKDFLRLPSLLQPLSHVPLFAVVGPRDHLVNRSDQLAPWAGAFAQAPAPFGSRPAPAGFTPVDSGAAVGAVHRYYAFDVNQNGSVMRAIVLDNSTALSDGPALDAAQSRWLDAQLEAVKSTNLPTVVFLSQPLNTSSNSDQFLLALRFIDAGVLAVVVPGDTNDNRPWPPEVALESRIPLISGATLGYQQAKNNGVAWYSIAVDVAKRTVSVQARPLVDSLALKPLIGLTVARSQTLAFEAVGRRPTGTLATTPIDPTFPGFDNYLNIPAPADCVTCVLPSYTFTSSDPTIGDFVLPSGLGSRLPELDNDGRPIPARSSGLFCAYNSGTTTVSVTVGSRRASLPVTVLAGGFGRPCGTVFREGVRPVVIVPSTRTVRSQGAPSGAGAPPPPPPGPSGESPPAKLPNFAVPFPAPLPPAAPERPAPPKPQPRVAPPQPAPPLVPAVFHPQPPPTVPNVPPVAVPPIPPNIQPIPPGGAASAQAAARRKEKAQKHASQSAFTTHQPGVPWFYGGVGAMTLLTLLLVAGGVRPDPRRRATPALAKVETRRRDRR
ncbi:hypothetical protein OM076_26480 [Solirubrobacter ginsenosidimutans]|uniref:Uncharacterized protein n=1 Tax=Solirubrobacter ginsenosidimutans TaxID=490573 RepID=A0A9X3S1U6_9ACTN|nr:hypothetical protein [Solirubrobacter ginsenosidimutans]MDA0163845.1 hypothetical protein [Solirubrobacter ginsenosidimutans]